MSNLTSLPGGFAPHIQRLPVSSICSQIALLKMFITRNGQATAEDAAQIFGGRSLTQGGMGRIIENVSILFTHPAMTFSNAYSIDEQLSSMRFSVALKVRCPFSKGDDKLICL